GQMLAAVVATVQTNNSIQLSDLQRRTERISRFLQRLGDLASDLDSEEATPQPTPTEIPVLTLTPTAQPTP
ncbi:MAG: hypothetical protein HGA19_16980, partial [Oscillochloris sp.]|nr:hypothetical protein [Oscillochloris sp.]